MCGVARVAPRCRAVSRGCVDSFACEPGAHVNREHGCGASDGDGSGRPNEPELRRCGWGVSQLNGVTGDGSHIGALQLNTYQIIIATALTCK